MDLTNLDGSAPRHRRGRLGAGCACAAVLMSVLSAATPDPTPASADPAPSVVTVPGGSFESPPVASGSSVVDPDPSPWSFSDTAGISAVGSVVSAGAPAFVDGTQAGFVQNAAKIVQRLWVEPGDVLSFQATQRLTGGTGPQTLAVAVDGVVVSAALTPGSGTWTSHLVPVPVTSPQRVNLEIRGLTLGAGQDRVALVDAVQILRPSAPIPDSGLAAQQQPGILENRTTPLAAGVVGVKTDGDSEPLIDAPVLAFAEWNDIVFVGGKFANVQRGQGAPLEDQSYLAAFDRETGAWVDTFRPVLDGPVWELSMTADGTLLVGGQFSAVNGAPFTAALAALNPSTGEVVPGWRASMILNGSTARPSVRAIEVSGDVVYVGGNFSRVVNTDQTRTRSGLAKLQASDGTAIRGFAPEIGPGPVYDIDATTSRVYVAGRFTTLNGEERPSLAVLDPVAGTQVPGLQQMQFTAADPKRWEQQAVLEIGDDVWVGGSEHTTQVYARADLARHRVFVNSPNGDTQTFALLNGYLYAGNHAPRGSFTFSDATDYSTLAGWTTKDPVRWIGAFDVARRTYVPTWTPNIGSASGEGAWELLVDSQSCLWAGGDFNRGSPTFTGTVYVEGFAKFCTVDSQAPATPTSPSASRIGTAVSVSWGPSTDDRQGAVTYEVLRNDRVIASGLGTTTYVDPTGTENDRYFVRAVDAAQNRSATTSVVLPVSTIVDTTRPSTPRNVVGVASGIGTAALTWTASRDDVGVDHYTVFRNNVEVAQVSTTTATITGLPIDTAWFQVQAFDAAGNKSYKTAPIAVEITGPDTEKPSIPKDLRVKLEADGSVTVKWKASTDNVGVVGYVVSRTYEGVTVQRTVTSTTDVYPSLPRGDHYFQVRAVDAAGNQSWKAQPKKVTVKR